MIFLIFASTLATLSMAVDGISIDEGVLKETEEDPYDPDKSGTSSVMPPEEDRFTLGGDDPLSVERDPGCMEETEPC